MKYYEYNGCLVQTPDINDESVSFLLESADELTERTYRYYAKNRRYIPKIDQSDTEKFYYHRKYWDTVKRWDSGHMKIGCKCRSKHVDNELDNNGSIDTMNVLGDD